MEVTARPMSLPAIRDLMRDESNGKIYRVVLAGGGAPDVALCCVFGSHLDIEHVSVTEFQKRTAPDYDGDDRLVQVDDDPFDPFKQVVRSTPGHVEKSDDNWKIIAELVGDPKSFKKTLYRGATRRRIFEAHAAAQGVSLQRFRRLYRQYLQAGMTRSAMSSKLWRCGRMDPLAGVEAGDSGKPEIKARKFKKRPGRPPSGGGHYATPSELLNRLFAQYVDIYLTSKQGPWEMDVPEELMADIRSAIANARFPARRRCKRKTRPTRHSTHKRWPHAAPGRDGKRKRRTMQDMVDHLNYVCRCTREVRDAAGQIVELQLAPFEEVTLRQFQHYWLTRVPVGVRKCRAMGERQYALTGRALHGHALQHCLGPGAEFMVDATIADVYLVSRFSRVVVVGRPTVYLVMDVWSRMIVGVHVTLDPPSFEGVALVLENVVTPKDAFCARHGLKIDGDMWPCQHFPSIGFVADHGSDYMKAVAWKAVTQRTHVSISNVRVRDPSMRGLMERRFGIIPFHYQSASFGVVERDATMRAAPHYAWDATDTLSEFTKKLLRAILVYHHMPIGREGAEPTMIFQHTANTPINRWYWGMDNLTGSLRKHSLEEIRMATWPHSMAKPTEKGLEWEGVYYTSPYIEETLIHCWGKHAREGVPIQFNPDDLSRIILVGKDRAEYGYQAGTNNPMPGDIDLKQWKIKGWMDRENRRKQNRAMQSQRVMENLSNMNESLNAKHEQRAALHLAGLTHPETVGMRAAREREKTAAKMQRALTGKSALAVAESNRDEPTAESDIVARLRRHTQDLLGD
jgi:putative transposase